MDTSLIIKKRIALVNSKQKGAVIIIALIILIIMSLAGIAANKALESAVGVAGNIAFKQSSVYGVDKAMESAIGWLNEHTAELANDNVEAGYLSSAATPEPDWTVDTAWTVKKAAGTDGVGNELEYVIHRMCSQANTSYNGDINQCMTIESESAQVLGNSLSAGSFQFKGAPQISYRITMRSKGPKGAYTVVQTFYTLPQ